MMFAVQDRHGRPTAGQGRSASPDRVIGGMTLMFLAWR